MSQTMKRDAREAMPATEPRDAEQAGVVEALKLAKRMVDEALPKFDWGRSALDGNAIWLLNQAPIAINQALAALAASPPPQPTPEAREAGDGWLERLEALARAAALGGEGEWRDDGAYYVLDQHDEVVAHGETAAETAFIAAANPATVMDLITKARAADAAEALLREHCTTQWSVSSASHSLVSRVLALLTGSKQ